MSENAPSNSELAPERGRYDRDVYEHVPQEGHNSGLDTSGWGDISKAMASTLNGTGAGFGSAGGGLSFSATYDDAAMEGRRETSLTSSGVFEGIAGTTVIESRKATDASRRFAEAEPGMPGKGKGGADLQEFPRPSESYAIFKDKSLPNPERRLPEINTFLGRDSRSVYEALSVVGNTGLSTMALQRTEKGSSSNGGYPMLLTKETDNTLLETPVDRVTRLQREVAELRELVKPFADIAAAAVEIQRSMGSSLDSPVAKEGDNKETTRTLATDDPRFMIGADPLLLLEELQLLQEHLDAVMALDAFKTMQRTRGDPLAETSAAIPDSGYGVSSRTVRADAVILKQLVDKIKTVEKKLTRDSEEAGVEDQTPGSVPADGAGRPAPPVTYELYTVPAPKEAFDVSRLLELERRLADLERIFGIDNKPAQWALPFLDVSTALKEVVSRLMLLTPSRVDALTKRFHTLAAQIDDLLHRKERVAALQRTTGTSSATDLNYQGRTSTPSGGVSDAKAIVDLYEFCESTRIFASALPAIVRRLKLLKVVHQNSANLGARLQALETQQAELHEFLRKSHEDLRILREMMSSNIKAAQELMASQNATTLSGTHATPHISEQTA